MLASISISHRTEVVVSLNTTNLLLAEPIRLTLHANEKIHYAIVSRMFSNVIS